jgi:DNA-binding IclR family transcriptional regulator
MNKKPSEIIKTRLRVLRRDTLRTAKKVFRQLMNHPGSSRGELVKYTRLTPEQVSRMLFTLKAVQAVRVQGSYRWARYWCKPKFSFS